MTEQTPMTEEVLKAIEEEMQEKDYAGSWRLQSAHQDMTKMIAEIRRLREENERLKKERTGLKGAVTYWRGRFEELEKERSLRGNGDSLRK